MLVLLTVLLSSLTISGWMAIKKEKQDTLKEINQRGEDISRFVAKSLSYSVVGYDYHAIQLLLDEITLSDDVEYCKVTSVKGNTMAESGYYSDKNNNMVIINRDIKFEDQLVGKLLMGLSTSNLVTRIESQKYALLKREAIIILMIAFGEFLALSFIIIRPVSIMSTSLRKNVDKSGRIVGKIPITSQDEFGQLAESFNNLSAQLNDANERLQSKVDLADKKLIETNETLVKQSIELAKMSEEFRMMSITDELTGLYNRRHFEDLMDTELKLANRHGYATSLVIMDIDYFKKVNDTYGHPCGDKVLQIIASALQARLRATDIICRLGGEEFVALCKQADKDGVTGIAEDLRQHVENLEIKQGNDLIKITISMGAATEQAGVEDSDVRNLYKKADAAVYYSKKHGRNRVTHFDDMEDLI